MPYDNTEQEPDRRWVCDGIFQLRNEYHEAANCLFNEHPTLRDPIHFLYFHAVELALKAFLRSHNIQILGTWRSRQSGHKLTKLYEECRGLGFTIGPDDKFEIGNIVSLLEKANEDQGLRYFNPKSGVMAALSWTREVVEHLMRAVELHLGAQQGPTSGPATKLTIILGKPVSK